MVNIGNSWDNVLKDEFQADYYKSLREFLKNEYSTKTIYPNMYDIFNAFRFTSYEDVKVVILGQDPYINERQAHGLAFSVQEGVYPPPSLTSIYLIRKCNYILFLNELYFALMQDLIFVNSLIIKKYPPYCI